MDRHTHSFIDIINRINKKIMQNNHDGNEMQSLVELLENSNGFVCFIDEGQIISVIVDKQSSLGYLTEYLFRHPDELKRVLAEIELMKAQLN